MHTGYRSSKPQKNSPLKRLGLNENEAIVYQFLLENGSKTPPEICTETNISRANAYFVLQSLMSMGLVERKDKNKKFIYSPLSPENIGKIIQTEKQSAIEKERFLESILPDLNNMFNIHNHKPSVSYFTGKSSLDIVMRDIILQKPDEALLFRSPYDNTFVGIDNLRKHAVKLAKAEINMRIISPSDPIFQEVDDVKIPRQTRYIDKDKYAFDSEICIYNNRVAISSYGKNAIGMIIENKELAATLRNIFELSWQIAMN